MLTGKHIVILHTNKGDITLELDADVAPKTVTNFITLAKTGVYDGLTFHRTMPNFMIQGGDPNGNGTGGESLFGPTFEDEINAASYGLNTKTLKDAAEGEPLPPEMEILTIQAFYEQQGYVYNSALKSLPMVKGALAMANRGPNTNGSQFFIIHGESTPWLDGRHTVFGNVTAGMDVVEAIATTPVVSRDSTNPQADRPSEPVTFTVEVK
ncbi:MAG: peptidylprolyl isomerase [Candidatus Peribacteraceae bacterium]|nr:peptidylprolyl isomerase [Candidatus Peribacteraceae bacterium]